MNPSREKHGLLIVDDEVEMLSSLKRIFRQQCRVFTANNVQSAMQIMEESQIAVVLSDQRMPQTTGTEFLAKIKENRPDVVTILITGYADIAAVIDAINKGEIYHYITKPCDPKNLSAIIEQAMEKYNLRQQNKVLLKQLQKNNQELEKKVEERTQQLQESNQYLEKLNKIKNEFLGMAAHDLRSPLSGLLCLSSLLQEPKEMSQEKRIEWATMMYQSCGNMLNIINNFLDISTIESGTIRLSPKKVNVYNFIQDVACHSETIATRNVKLEVKMDDDIPYILFDPYRIKQVCNNLLSNAYKFAEKNSTITLAAFLKQDFVEIMVSNIGEQIDQEKLTSIFQPFSQLQSGKKHYNSVGLGLSICKKLVNMHNGEISVTSSDGTTRFSFTLPLQ